jgi:hypothetical protein
MLGYARLRYWERWEDVRHAGRRLRARARFAVRKWRRRLGGSGSSGSGCTSSGGGGSSGWHDELNQSLLRSMGWPRLFRELALASPAAVAWRALTLAAAWLCASCLLEASGLLLALLAGQRLPHRYDDGPLWRSGVAAADATPTASAAASAGGLALHALGRLLSLARAAPARLGDVLPEWVKVAIGVKGISKVRR